MMTEDHLQWIAIIGIYAWLVMISMWIGETTTLLKDWWSDHLRGWIIRDHRDKVSSGYEPGEPYKPRPLTSEPQKRNGDD